MLFLPLYASLPPSQQRKIFRIAPPHTRKVIFATNVAETSITIPGVRFVIDTGLAKMRSYNPRTGVESLKVSPISQANAAQRAGRAGRDREGSCFRIYTHAAFLSLPEFPVPEMKRVNLTAMVLMLKAYGVADVVDGFPYIERPDRQAIVKALECLYGLGALSQKHGELTKRGKLMAELPLDPCYARVLIESKVLGCTDAAITLISLLSVESIYCVQPARRDDFAEMQKLFVHASGDFLTLMNVMRGYLSVAKKGRKKWCSRVFVSEKSMAAVMEIRDQLFRFCQRHGYKVSTCEEYALALVESPMTSSEEESLAKCFLSGLYANTAVYYPQDNLYKTLVDKQEVYVHPSSALFRKQKTCPAVMFDQILTTKKAYARNVWRIDMEWIQSASPIFQQMK